MRRFIVGLFAVIGVVVVLAAAAGIGFALWRHERAPVIADNTVLTIDIGSGFPDAPPSAALSKLLEPGKPSLREVLDAIDRASDDPRVTGLVARVGDGELGISEAQELRNAILRFRAKGKRTVAYADTFGELSSDSYSYYFASAFDDIWLQPMGLVGLVEPHAEEPFFRGTLDLLGVMPEFATREQYKSAVDPMMDKTMTAPDREQITALLNSVNGQIVRAISTDRKIDETTVRGLVGRGPLLSQEALAAHLVTHIGYSDEAMASLGVTPGGPKRPMPLMRYLNAAGRPHRSGPEIALIYATGLITRGNGEGNGLVGSGEAGADALVKAFRMAERDPQVRAILFRIDSPGGSAVASETIWREIERAKQAGKKVVVSMGGVAASGGYYIAADADKIVADPGTLTGSIGVLAGKVVLTGLLNKVGAGVGTVDLDGNSSFFSAFQEFSPDQQARLGAFLDDVYGGFKAHVAQGRKMTPDAVEAVAKGRVWTGEDAKAKGLVDTLGGYHTALDVAKEEAGIPATSDVTLKLFPPPRSPIDVLIARLTGRGDNDDDEVVLGRTLAALHPLLVALEWASLPPGTLTMAPIELR